MTIIMKTFCKKVEALFQKDCFWKWSCIIVFGIVNVMYLYLALCKTFHYDEAYSIGIAANSFGEIIDITSRDVHSPFYYFVLKLFCMLPGLNELVGAKILSWLFMFLYMAFSAYVVYRRYGWKVAFFWTLVSGFVPSMIIQSTTVRMYTMGLFFVTVASYLAYSIYQRETMKKWILFTICSALSVYIHTFCLLEMVAVCGVLLLAVLIKKKYKMLGKVLGSGIIVSICFLPWLFTLWQQFTRWAGWENGWEGTFLPVSLESSTIYLSEWFSSMEYPQPLTVLFWVVLLLFASFHVRDYVRRSKDYLPCMGMILVGIILVVATVVSNYVAPCFLGRYALPLFAGVWLFAAIGIAKCQNYIKQIVISVLVIFFGIMAYRTEVQIEDASGLNTYIECVENNMDLSEDVIMADRYFNMMFSIYYPEARYMVYGYSPEGLPFRNTETFTSWEQLEGVDTVWLISFADNQGADLSEKFEAIQSFTFDYSYYQIKVEKLTRR